MPMKFGHLLLLLSVTLIVGCDGCRRDPSEQDPDEQAPEEQFVSEPARVFPAEQSVIGAATKPGHWASASFTLKSNKADIRGQLSSQFWASAATSAEDGQRRLPSVRPVVLPKGQKRRFDYRLLVPALASSDARQMRLANRFTSTGEGIYYESVPQPINLMSPEEYCLVVLTDRPQRFAKFRKSDWVRPSRDALGFSSSQANYRIVIPPTGDVLPLSETMLDWTSTAVLWWDNLSADSLTPAQQLAISDWVNFGGTLVVNGADAAEAINQSSLAGVLPLRPTANIELDAGAAKDLLQNWAVATDRTVEKQIAVVDGAISRVAIDGVKAADAVELPGSGNLVLSRRQGLGHVVQVRFDMTDDWITSWASFDSFVNGSLLRRPRRKYTQSEDRLDEDTSLQHYPDLGSRTVGADVNTRFRLSSRDAALPIAVSQERSPNADEQAAVANVAPRIDRLTYEGTAAGIGGWNDQSDVVSLFREVVDVESAIEVPEMSLVVRALGIYLLILVPVNYLIFRLMGRLEYAWLAVPVIAIIGTVWVTQAVRLNIGFARSQTELALLEIQPDYDRGHVTRVATIYNSLSNQYEIQFATGDGAAAPVGILSGSRQAGGEVFRNSFGNGPSLSGFAVESNSTNDSSFHAEQIIELGGSVTMETGAVINGTEFDFQDVYVVDKDLQGATRVAVLGACDAGSRTEVKFPNVAQAAVPDELPLQTARVIRRLISGSVMHPGSTRLVARIDAAMPDMTVTPRAEQMLVQTIVLAHLRHAPLPEPTIDVNLLADTVRVQTDTSSGR